VLLTIGITRKRLSDTVKSLRVTTTVQKLDSLKDVMWELQQRYEEEIELGRIYWEERRKLREETA